jgi:glutathione synthase/RimK-type ligase-like ATP-grasp enzyme
MKIALLTSKDLPNLIEEEGLMIEALSRHGIDSEILIWNEDHNWAAFDAVLVRTTWDYIKFPEDFANKLKEISEQTKLINPLDTILWNMDKSYLLELTSKMPVVETLKYLEFTEDNWSEALAKFNNDMVVKPMIGASGYDTFHVQDFNQMQFSALKGRAVLAQKFIPSIKTEGEYSFLYFGGEFSHAIQKTPTNNEFRIQEEHGGVYRPYDPSVEEIENCREMIQKASRPHFYARVDVVRDEKQMKLMELELIEPQLFWENAQSNSLDLFAQKLKLQIDTN